MERFAFLPITTLMPHLIVTHGSDPGPLGPYLHALRVAGWEGSLRCIGPDGETGLDGCVGVLLSGGADIHPGAWGEAVHPAADPDPARDALELPLVRAAWSADLPILGICRGMQALNVALGGSLHQHVPEAFGCPADRHQHGSGSAPPEIRHPVEADPSARLASILGGALIPVNSRHHQAVNRLAAGLRAVAWDPHTVGDGGPLIEGIEAVDPNRWAFGVQWHPENLVAMDGPAGEAARGLFHAFLAVARRA